MKTEKITKGKWTITEASTSVTWYRIEANGGVVCDLEIDHKEGTKPTKDAKEAAANAQLIAEAGTVKNETGFSPRQLAERNKKLLEALKEAIIDVRLRCTDLKLDYKKYSTWQKCNEALNPTKI